jgi:hypothetical protein
LPKPIAVRDVAITKLQLLRWPTVLSRLRRAGGGEGRYAQATSRTCARFWVPRQFTLENRRLPLTLPQSFGKLRTSHVSLDPLSARTLHPATEKSCAVVQKLWTMPIPCGIPWKNGAKLLPRFISIRIFNNLHTVKLSPPVRFDSSQQQSSAMFRLQFILPVQPIDIRRLSSLSERLSPYVALTIRGQTVQLTLL